VIEEIRPGLKRWTTTEHDWKPEEDLLDVSYRPVASLLLHGTDALVLVDPLVPGELWPALDDEVAESGAPAIVLTTISFHSRSRDDVARRYGAKLGGSPPGVQQFSMARGDEVALWLEEQRALVFGDAVLGDQQGGLRLTPWSKDAAGLARTCEAIRVLLDLPIELVLPSHGNVVLSDGKAALERALA
jgi:glyoxylase-like metal-dependent hydrolase (beta-lactamase superfamily II)